MKFEDNKTKCIVGLLKTALVIIAALAIPVNINASGVAQFMKLFDCDGTNEAAPDGGLLLYSNVLYGTTCFGNMNENDVAGPGGTGTIFKINPDGSGFQILYNFSSLNSLNTDGAMPQTCLVAFSNILYGVAPEGGANGNGTVFKINTDGTGFTTVYTFSALTADDGISVNDDGANPNCDLVLSNSVLYGTTMNGGTYGYGAVFKVNTDGSGFLNLHSFTGEEGDGLYPLGGLVLCSNTLYGTTTASGTAPYDGAVFAVNTDGSGFSVLHNFLDSDGNDPEASLALSGNILYGTTVNGGSYENGTLFKINTDGTGFISLFSFGGDTDSSPRGKLVLSGTNLFGLLANTVFRINIDGSDFTDLSVFDYRPGTISEEGDFPSGDLALSGQTLYGVAGGGIYNYGIIFCINPIQPVIDNILLDTNGAVTIFSTGSAGYEYLMQATTSITPPVVWQNISTNIADTNGNWQFTDYSLTNRVYESYTNLIYSGGGPSDFTNSSPPTVIGTNIGSGYFPEYPIMFYRAATIP